jgi:hypothetical protein
MPKSNYSEIFASNGIVEFNVENPIHEKTFDKPYTYLKIYRPRGRYKVYINNSPTYIVLYNAAATWEAGVDQLILEGIQINQFKIEADEITAMGEAGDENSNGVQYYLMR